MALELLPNAAAVSETTEKGTSTMFSGNILPVASYGLHQGVSPVRITWAIMSTAGWNC